MSIAAGARLGPYEVVALLGAGGMGEVYRARDTRLGRDVAIKVLPAEFTEDPERLKRFEREAKATAALSHPNILNVHDVGTFEGVPYLVEELLEGESLKERLERGALGVAEAVRIAGEVARGLAAAHEKGIVHRDLKPANVFLTSDGRVKVLDFGLAKLVGTVPLGEAETLTRAPTATTELGSVVGTVAYMAPEQARGMPVDQRADVFAFGVVVYEMVAGERPFVGATGTDVVAAILKEEPPPLSASVPPELVAVIGRCLAKEPERRYQRGGELLAALEAVRAEGAAPLWGSLRHAVRRRPWLMAANVVVTLVVLALALDVGGIRRRLLGGQGGATRSIKLAVLPFANLSGDPEQEYLSDGVTQEMIAQLGRLHPERLSVIARTSVMRYKKGDTPVDQIGRELGVDYVLEGSAQREADRVRIAAELIHVADQTQLWADTYERQMSGILALQSEVAQRVAKALALKLLPAEQARLATVRTVNPGAYEAYLKGTQAWITMTKGGLETAERYFALAAEKDPTYAAAWAGIARVWRAREQLGMASPDEAGPKAKAAVLRALHLDQADPEAHRALAGILTWSDWDWAAAERQWKRLFELDQNHADGLSSYSHFLLHMGRRAEAIEASERALELDPFNVKIQSFHAIALVDLRRYDDAIAAARAALRMQADAPLARNALYQALHFKGMYDEALALDRERYSSDRELIEALERGYAEAGYAGARRRFADVQAARFGRPGGVRAWAIAHHYMWAGDRDHAFEWLERAYEARDPSMTYIGGPTWGSVRTDPRYQDLLRRMNLPVLAPDDNRQPTGGAS